MEQRTAGLSPGANSTPNRLSGGFANGGGGGGSGKEEVKKAVAEHAEEEGG